jgi:hypothetical protein
MAAPRKRAGDLTGIETERLQKENQAELKKRSQEISMMAEVEAEENAVPIDYSDGPLTRVVEDELYQRDEEIELETPTRTIIPNTTLESVTFGAGQHYNFEEGRKYTVPLDLARHLDSKGLLWTGGYR